MRLNPLQIPHLPTITFKQILLAELKEEKKKRNTLRMSESLMMLNRYLIESKR